MNIMFRIFTFLIVTISLLNANDIQVFSMKNSDGKITPKTIEKEFEKLGFEISDNRDMNIPFKKQFKQTDFTVYNLFTPFHYTHTYNLAKSYPDIALFSPMSMSIYTRNGDDTINVSSLTIDAMSKITGVPKDNKDLIAIAELVKKALKNAMPKGQFVKLDYKVAKSDKPLVSKFEMDMSSDGWSDEKDNFQLEFEGFLEQHGFVMAGFNKLNYKFKEMGETPYNFYETYSICKLPVIYEVAKTRPEAGAFAPCSLYNYMKKGEEKMIIAYPNVYNWISSANVTDKKALEELEDAQKRMVKILKGMTE